MHPYRFFLSNNFFDTLPKQDTSTWKDDDGWHLEVQMPGVKPEDIQIEVLDGIISLRGESAGRFSQEFHYRYRLPKQADVEGIVAKNLHGLLQITVPTLAAAQPRRIEIQTA